MNTIYDGTFVLGNTSATTYQAGPGISITQPSEGTVKISNDETVLWDGHGTLATSATLSEAMTNFETVKIYFINADSEVVIREIDPSVQAPYITQEINTMSTEPKYYCKIARFDIAGNTITRSYQVSYTIASNGISSWSTNNTDTVKILKVVGINRISGGNA